MNLTIDDIAKDLNRVTYLKDRVIPRDYKNKFYDHLYDMMKFDFVDNQNKQIEAETFTLNKYQGLEQFIFENSTVVEKDDPKDIDWDLLDDARDLVKKKVKKLLGHEKNSETLKPLLDFTVDSFQNYLMYLVMHPDSNNNPWDDTKSIFETGYLFMAADDSDFIKEYNVKILNDTYSGNLSVVAKAKKEKKFYGFTVDNRLTTAALVQQYLFIHAKGHSNAKKKSDIINSLSRDGRTIKTSRLYTHIIKPMKRAGIIGSSTKGYFYINNQRDLQAAYNYHRGIIKGIKATTDIYEARAKRNNWTLR